MGPGRIVTKLRLSAALAFAVILAIGLTALERTRASHADVDEFTDVQFPATQLLAQIAEARLEVDRAAFALDAVGLRSPEAREDLRADLDVALAVLDEGLTSYQATAQARSLGGQWTEVRSRIDAWRSSLEPLTAALDRRAQGGGEPAAAAVASAWTTARAASKQVEQALLAYRKAAAGQVEQVKARSGTSLRTTSIAIGLVVLLGSLAAMGSAWVLVRSVRRSLRALVDEAARMEHAIEDGALDVRADARAASAEFAPVVEGMNRTVEAFLAPLRLTADYIDRIARGDIPAPVEAEYRGEFAATIANLNRCIAAVNALVEDAGKLAAAGAAGELAVRADASRHAGDFRKVVEGMNRTYDGLIGPLGLAAGAVADIAAGHLPPEVEDGFPGDLAPLRANLNGCIRAVRALVRDARALADAGAAGQLSVRAEAGAHQGEFRTIVEGMNRTLDAVVRPLQVTARCVDQIAAGELPAPLSDEWAGDFRQLRDNLNTCIQAVSGLVQEMDGLAGTAVQGSLAQRADPKRHRGDYRRIVEGVNRTLDALLAPVTETTAALETLAARDLRATVEGQYRGDHSRLKDALNSTARALHGAMGQVASSVRQVSLAASQIASSSQAVATGASEQAASLAETGSLLESVAGMARSAAESAQQASALATTARAAASDGTAAVDRLKSTMGRITRSAEGTSQIIRDVSDIAFQTNLLALNAAVEAARAGEAGRGFAVVAEEVRSLALRAKEAASKTEDLIRQSVEQATDGDSAAQEVAGKLGDIVLGVSKVTDIVAEIASSAQAQVTALAGVNQAVTEMDRVTQQNAASAEESSAAAGELSGQSEELAAMVATFRLERETSGAELRARTGGAARGPRP
jgi:methyl-accepting chemotaxis protein